MNVAHSEFLVSNTKVENCPKSSLPEYAFIGRSNVGKSSLINMLCNRKKLAKTSSRPGKTKLINHFLINKEWHLVDLPGYGYARASKTEKKTFQKFIIDYLNKRQELVSAFLLIDIRHEPQPIDLDFLRWLGKHFIPFSIVFTKADKINEKEMTVGKAEGITGGLDLWGQLENFTPPKEIIDQVINNKNNIGDKDGKK